MSTHEKEVKFKVDMNKISTYELMQNPNFVSCIGIHQVYIFDTSAGTLRIRQETDFATRVTKFVSTIKGRQKFADGRVEIERDITKEEFYSLYTMKLPGRIDKTRYNLNFDFHDRINRILSIDVFERCNSGLVIAELEYTTKDVPVLLAKPEWLGEIVEDPALYNSNLLAVPFIDWTPVHQEQYRIKAS
jgi:CYTH domain-containing protein